MSFKKFLTTIILITTFSFFNLNVVSAASYDFSPSYFQFIQECASTLNLLINIEPGQTTNAGEVIINFDPSRIQILDSIGANAGVQVAPGNAFESYFYNTVDNSAGIIRVAAYSLNSVHSGSAIFASINFVSTSIATSGSFNIVFNGAGATLDSNIGSGISSDDLLTSVTNGNFIFEDNDFCGVVDNSPPAVNITNPVNGSTNVATNSPVVVNITDDNTGVDISTIVIIINGQTFTQNSPGVIITGTPQEYNITITGLNLPTNTQIPVEVNVSDLLGNDISRDFNFTTAQQPTIITNPGTGGEETPVTPDDPLETIREITRDAFNFISTNASYIAQQLSPAGVIATGLSALLLLIPLLSYFNIWGVITTILAFLINKKRRPWGVVLDAETGKPLALSTCRLFAGDSVSVLNQTLSDLDGTYGFAIESGKYRLEILKEGYKPFAAKIEIPQGEDGFVFDVMMSPLDSEYLSTLTNSQRFANIAYSFLNKLRILLFIFGFTFSIYAVSVSPITWNVLILTAYIIILIVNILLAVKGFTRLSAVVNSSSGENVPYAIVKVYDIEKWKNIDTLVANSNGFFDYFGAPGEYGLIAAARGYQFPSKKQSIADKVKGMYGGVVKALLSKGRNRIKLLVDPASGDYTQKYDPNTRLQTPFG